jgi:RNA polymerase sigma-70 factor (family 1)
LIKSSKNIEREIVEKVAKGDHQAFRIIFDQYKDVLYGYSYKLTKSNVLAEEAIQEVFLKFWQNRRDLNPDLSVKAYLYKITKNHLFNLLRNAAYDHQLKQQLFYNRRDTHYSTEDQLIYRDLETFKNQAIANLPPKMQQIFHMSRTQELSHKEIAHQLGISQHTVKDQIVKALKSIKEYLRMHTDIAVNIVLFMQIFC